MTRRYSALFNRLDDLATVHRGSLEEAVLKQSILRPKKNPSRRRMPDSAFEVAKTLQ